MFGYLMVFLLAGRWESGRLVFFVGSMHVVMVGIALFRLIVALTTFDTFLLSRGWVRFSAPPTLQEAYPFILIRCVDVECEIGSVIERPSLDEMRVRFPEPGQTSESIQIGD